MINKKTLEKLLSPNPPLTGGFTRNRCNNCGYQFTLDNRMERAGLLSWLSTKKCPKCGSKDIRMTGLIKS